MTKAISIEAQLLKIQSRTMSVRLKFKISVTAELIGLYSSGNIATGPVVV